MRLPSAFCWTKFGTESGEASAAILHRKENERQTNQGLFLWGVGNSIRPSLVELLRRVASPEVYFTPMLSRPGARDVSPERVLIWTRAVGLDGEPYPLPPHSIVISGAPVGSGGKRHYALVCRSDVPIQRAVPGGSFRSSSVVNLLTGRAVGSSQVTSVVEPSRAGLEEGPSYSVAFKAVLEYPYFVSLSDPVEIPAGKAGQPADLPLFSRAGAGA